MYFDVDPMKIGNHKIILKLPDQNLEHLDNKANWLLLEQEEGRVRFCDPGDQNKMVLWRKGWVLHSE